MLSVVIPLLNEEGNVCELVERIDKALENEEYEVIFIDDSTDGTPDVLKKIAETNCRVFFEHRKINDGLARAVLRGFEIAKGETLAVMDGDLQHPPEILKEMLLKVNSKADIVIASRNIADKDCSKVSLHRKIHAAFFLFVGRLFLPGYDYIKDPSSGMFMIRRSVIEGVDMQPSGWKILAEILGVGEWKNVIEVPYSFGRRKSGESKLNLSVHIECIKHLSSLKKRMKVHDKIS